MSEKEPTLYQRIKSGLEARRARRELWMAGEMLTCGDDSRGYSMQENVSFFLAPLPAVDFDPRQLEECMRKLELEEPRPNHMVLLPNWRREFGSPSELDALTFPVVSYGEKLEKEEDLLFPSVYQVLREEGLVPEFNRFHSFREISIHIYPSWTYAREIFDYKEGLQVGRLKREPVMDFLSHSITREQLGVFRANPDRSFKGLTLPPLRKVIFTGL